MPKKRRSGGRRKGKSGRPGTVQCSSCGRLVPRDKAKKVTVTVTLVDPQLAKELRKQGAYVPVRKEVKYYCVSCAVHRGIVKIRAEDERKYPTKRF